MLVCRGHLVLGSQSIGSKTQRSQLATPGSRSSEWHQHTRGNNSRCWSNLLGEPYCQCSVCLAIITACGLHLQCLTCRLDVNALLCFRYHTTTQRWPRQASIVRHAQKQQFSSFDDMVQNSELPVLVDFYATWCGPCQIMSQVLSVSIQAHHTLLALRCQLGSSQSVLTSAPSVQKLSTQMGDKIKIVKIDTDK